MTRCVKIIVGLIANFGNVFYQTFMNVILLFPRFYVFHFFFNFYMKFYDIYGLINRVRYDCTFSIKQATLCLQKVRFRSLKK